jgi:hypothetical protein
MTSRLAVSILLDDACSSLANCFMEIHADLGNEYQSAREKGEDEKQTSSPFRFRTG